MSSFLNNSDTQVELKRKLASGVLQRFFVENRDIDVILTSKNDKTLKEYLVTLDQSLSERDNQNAFSIITVGETKIISSSTTDEVVIIPGNGISIIPDAKNKSLKISGDDVSEKGSGLMTPELLEKLNSVDFDANNYEHPKYPNVPPGTDYIRVSVDEYGHVYAASKTAMKLTEGGTGATTAAEARKNLGAASTDLATETSAGLMSSEMFKYIQDLITNGLKPTPIPVSYIYDAFGVTAPASN